MAGQNAPQLLSPARVRRSSASSASSSVYKKLAAASETDEADDRKAALGRALLQSAWIVPDSGTRSASAQEVQVHRSPQQSSAHSEALAKQRVPACALRRGPERPNLHSDPVHPGRCWFVVYPPGRGPPRRVAQTTMTKRLPTGLQWIELPVELLQYFMDLLPTFAERMQMCAVCKLARRLEWRLGSPLRPDEELSGRRLGDIGTRAVVWSCATPLNPPIGELCLGENDIGDAGALVIAALLESGCSIRRLSLRDNNIGDVGASAIASALKANSTLEELDIWGNALTNRGKHALLSTARCKVFLESSIPRAPGVTWLQTAVSSRLRGALFDWISQVHTGGDAPLALDVADPQDTLFRTLCLADAYFAQQTVQSDKLQLVGLACTFGAVGLDKTVRDELDETELSEWLASVSEGAFTAEDVRREASDMRSRLGFKMYQPTPYTFLRRFLRRTGWTDASFSLANYLMELMATESASLRYRPQAIAAAAAVLSRQYVSQGIDIQQISGWKEKLVRCAQVDLRHELAPCATAMARLHAAKHSRPGNFVTKKYELARLHTVAKIAPKPELDAAFFERYFSVDHAPRTLADHASRTTVSDPFSESRGRVAC